MKNLNTQNIINWITSHKIGLLLNSNNLSSHPTLKSYEMIVAVGSTKEITGKSINDWQNLSNFIKSCQLNNQYVFGYLTYDLKNNIEDLSSKNIDQIEFPPFYFFVPEHLILVKDNNAEIISDNKNLLAEIASTAITNNNLVQANLKPKVTKQNYVKNVNQIKQHIIDGDVYELNYCIEFFEENITINPSQVFSALQQVSPTPFGAYFKLNQNYLMCASPERFIKKVDNTIYSQPIKGTAKRGTNNLEDEFNKQQLLNSEKERAENLMIVDLVRNDLAKSCKTGTIKVDELFGIYSFKQVHQMISTVSGELQPNINPVDIITNAFPMGSMTGAPKIMAMKLIDQYEETKRGLYSGAVGFFEPNGDFDFNVVIRSLQYNQQKKYLNCMVGSAITFDSIAEQEYDECLIKAQAMINALKQ